MTTLHSHWKVKGGINLFFVRFASALKLLGARGRATPRVYIFPSSWFIRDRQRDPGLTDPFAFLECKLEAF